MKMGQKVKNGPLWNSVKVAVMKHLMQTKAQQCERFRIELLNSIGSTLIENTNHPFWARGRDNKGLNMCGVLLEEVRETLLAGVSTFEPQPSFWMQKLQKMADAGDLKSEPHKDERSFSDYQIGNLHQKKITSPSRKQLHPHRISRDNATYVKVETESSMQQSPYLSMTEWPPLENGMAHTQQFINNHPTNNYQRPTAEFSPLLDSTTVPPVMSKEQYTGQYQPYQQNHENRRPFVGQSPLRQPVPSTRYTQEQYHSAYGQVRDAYCWFCGEQGHVKQNCRHGKPIQCRSCDEYGHKSKHHRYH